MGIRANQPAFRKLMHTSVIQKALRSVAPAVKAVSRSIDNMGATLEVCRFGPLQLSTALAPTPTVSLIYRP